MTPETGEIYTKARRDAVDFAVVFFLSIATFDYFTGSDRSVQALAFQTLLTAAFYLAFTFWRLRSKNLPYPRLRDGPHKKSRSLF
ncbi:hypothetical protein [Dongia rigui]|uniref:Uncharacterized protein n=1 Tax=Dongia rigui TaxID=940149 RepID=A0ABU5E4T4_9PROT|nr:hypothetical protein [Dongia rigui]MDY0874220.1 hypothetical protein [Dongia rigui]